MNAMDVLIMPSKNEGWPCVVLEAQACGVPVVGSNVGGIPEAVGNEGAIVRNSEDFENRFAETVIKVLNKKFDTLLLHRKAKNYDWRYIVEREINIYSQIMGKMINHYSS